MPEENQNPTFDFDRMKVKNKGNFPFVIISEPPRIANYADMIDRFCLLDQTGKIFTRSEVMRLVAKLERFYEVVTDEEITKYNNAPRPELEPGKSSPKPEGMKHPKKVYLMRSNGDCKIGVSIDPHERLKQITAPSIELLHFFDADDAIEAEEILHKTYQGKRINGEWFRLSDTDIENIKLIIEFRNSKFSFAKE